MRIAESRLGLLNDAMRILPVLDLQAGFVVRGIAGRRQDYRPLHSSLASGSDPLAIARAFRDHFGLTELYLADLDAIAGAEPAWATWAALHDDGFQLWLDAGISRLARAEAVAAAGIASMVIGLETLAGPAELAAMVKVFGPRIVFSLDLRGGRPLGNLAGWRSGDAWSLAAQAVDLGITRLLVLDLAHVGVNKGTGTEDLCARLTKSFPQLEVSAGGGVRNLEDLQRLQAGGVHNVLVASALHDGRLTRKELQALASGGP